MYIWFSKYFPVSARGPSMLAWLGLDLDIDVAWLRQNELARLDAFQARSLRRICRIQHSYYSRISNIQSLKETSSIQLNSLLAQRQSMLFGKIACKDHALNPIRALVFNSADSFDPPHMNWQRKRGRPRVTWTAEVHKLALNVSSNRTKFHQLLYDSKSCFSIWTRLVNTYQQPINIDWLFPSLDLVLCLPFLLSCFIARFPCRLFASLWCAS